jgi:hypothetical protein
MNIGKIVLSVSMLAASCCSFVSAQGKTSVPTKESCLAFVQEFYGWYVPKARDLSVDSLDLALKQRRSAFSVQVIKEVEAVEADARRNREAGLDFDWILNTQDAGDAGDPGYLVRNSKLNGNVCRAEVYRQLPEGKVVKDVVPDLSFEHGRWLFVNFHYPDSRYNLLNMTKQYLDSVSKSAAPAQDCFKIRGRAVLYRGDAFFQIWQVGTHHVFFPADKQSADLICEYFDCESGDRQPALFADFTVLPAERHKPGAAQPVFVKKVQHPRIVPDWPPQSDR